jgi:hypothetical protein
MTSRSQQTDPAGPAWQLYARALVAGGAGLAPPAALVGAVLRGAQPAPGAWSVAAVLWPLLWWAFILAVLRHYEGALDRAQDWPREQTQERTLGGEPTDLEALTDPSRRPVGRRTAGRRTARRTRAR